MLGQVKSAYNGRATKIGGGLFISFLSKENLTLGDFIRVIYKDLEYSFEVFCINTEDALLNIQAKENGYWGNSLRNNKSIDLRDLIGLDVVKVTDLSEIATIKEQSKWC